MTKVLSDDTKNAFVESIPLHRPGAAEDVANAVMFFASDASGYITGQVLSVDGGLYI